MAKIFQVVDNECRWHMPFTSLAEVMKIYPKGLTFIEAPDFVFEGWGYKEEDEDGNKLLGNDRFIKPVPPEGQYYDDDLGDFFTEEELPARLLRVQNEKQTENKIAFAKYLDAHPLIWTDGKEYGITMEDQSEIQLNISQYQIQLNSGVESPVLEWHARHEKCVAWTIEELSKLALAITSTVYPVFQKMNAYKQAIYDTKTLDDAKAIVIDYSDIVTEEDQQPAKSKSKK